MTCAHFTDLADPCCSAGVNYIGHAGGSVYSAVFRLPCLPITDRKGNEVRQCARFTAREVDKSTESHVDRTANLHDQESACP